MIKKPFIYLYAYENNQFVKVAVIDDYEEVSWESSLYEAGTFTIQMNYNLPNANLLQKGLFVQFGDDPYKFGEINDIENSLGNTGKGSQQRVATGYDARYLFKKRIIKNLNTSEAWTYTGAGELCMRQLVYSQCGLGESNTKRRLPISNSIPTTGIGGAYIVSEAFSNLYDVLVTIATQTQIGWRVAFSGALTLDIYEGSDKSSFVRFNASMQTIDSGSYTDTNEEYTNAVYIGGKGNGADRDIYTGETEDAIGLARYETWFDKPDLTSDLEYEIEARAILNQYSQTISIEGKGLTHSPFVFDSDYFVGDTVNFAFSGISANVPVLKVTECWSKGNYDISFEVGKPVSGLNRQLSLLLKKIQSASAAIESKSTSSIKWYTIPTDTQMAADEITNDVIGFVGNVSTGATFKLYFNSNGTGSKIYHVYLKELTGTGKLTLTTNNGASNLVLDVGTYVTIIYVDNNGNITTMA